jgi:hypothetical protein
VQIFACFIILQLLNATLLNATFNGVPAELTTQVAATIL